MPQANAPILGSVGSGTKAHEFLQAYMRRGQSFSGKERNCCYLNLDGERFANVAALSGFDFSEDGRGMAIVDWDQDGDLDLWLKNRNAPQVRFLRNEFPSDYGFVQFVLEGSSSNRDAIGTRISVNLETPPMTLTRTLRAGSGFLSQSSKRVHFGLGPDKRKIQSVEVVWPNGKSQRFGSLARNRAYKITEGKSAVSDLAKKIAESVEVAVSTEPSTRTRNAMLLSTPLPLPTLSFRSSDGKLAVVQPKPNRSTLVCLWAKWCKPCVNELKLLTEHRKELETMGIDVLALSVEKPDATVASRMPEGVDLSMGVATSQFLETFQVARDYAHFRTQSIPLPSSFLIDERGIHALYSDTISLSELKHDWQLLRSSSEQSRRVTTMPLTGRWFLPEREHRVLWIAAKLLGIVNDVDLIAYLDDNVESISGDSDLGNARLRLGMRQFAYGKYEIAKEQINKSIAASPNVENLFALGATLQMLDQNEEAKAAFNRSATMNAIRTAALHLEFAQQMDAEAKQSLAQWHKTQALRLKSGR